MHQFKDKDGREWRLAIDAPAIMAIRKDIDPEFLMGDLPTETFNRLGSDPALICLVIYSLCRKQIAVREMTEESFYVDVLGDGDTIEPAGLALQEAILNFIPPRSRILMKANAAVNRKHREIGVEETMKRLNEPTLDDRARASIRAKLDTALDEALTLPSNATNSPAIVASPPTA
ncbi:MAG: hypothetical protein K8T91_21405 [Planctomycetes bacterium]|nr:hypothetical protein [Planctomycetota bacterium]